MSGSALPLPVYDRIVREDESGCDVPTRADEQLEVEWWELDRRALRKTTGSGRQVRILLALGEALHDGVLLSDSEGRSAIRVCLVPCELLVMLPRNPGEMGVLALELGNLHVPAEVVDGSVRAVADGPAEAVAAGLGIPFRREVGLFHPRRCAGMPELRMSSDFRTISR